MDRKRAIIEKVKKLLALSGSDNEHEAALAAAKAQEILERENLSLFELTGFNEAEIKTVIVNGKCRHQRWDLYLFSTLSKTYEVFPYLSKKERKGAVMVVVGYPQDLKVFEYVYIYLKGAVERLTKREIAKIRRRRKRDFRMNRKDARLYNISFKYGAAVRICELVENLRNERLSRNVKCRDLVISRKKQVNDWVNQNLRIKSKNLTEATVLSDAYDHGYDKANDISLREGLEGREQVRTLR